MFLHMPFCIIFCTCFVISFCMSCAPVRRIRKNIDYSSSDYEVFVPITLYSYYKSTQVYMIHGGLQNLILPQWQGKGDEDPTTVVLDKLKEDIGLHGQFCYILTGNYFYWQSTLQDQVRTHWQCPQMKTALLCTTLYLCQQMVNNNTHINLPIVLCWVI